MYRLLVGNNFENIGRRLAEYISHFGFETENCSNAFADMSAELDKNSYDGLFFFAFDLNDRTRAFINECRLKFPCLKIFIASNHRNSNRIRNSLSSVISKNIVFPYNEFDVCYEIAECFYSHREMTLNPKTAEFLAKRNFPVSCRGFYYYCCLIECAVKEPDSIDSLTRKLYVNVAEKMNTTYANVERGIRVMLTNAYKRGIIINGNTIHDPIKNKKLIRILYNDYKDIFLSMNPEETFPFFDWV